MPEIDYCPPSFDDVVDITMDGRRWKAAMLRAYFDASQRNSGVMAVAGVSFGHDQAKKAGRAWRDLFGDRVFHMTDLHARRGEFAGVSDEEADRMCRAAVGIISRHAHAVVATSCNVADVGKIEAVDGPASDLLADAVHSAYNLCLHLAMHSMGSITGRREGEIQYWFEAGDRYQGIASRFLLALCRPDAKPMRQAYSFCGYTVQDKLGALLFQAADLVAWEWAKHVDRVAGGMEARPSLAVIMGGTCVSAGAPVHRSRTRLGLHFDRAAMRRFHDRVEILMAATSVDQVDAIVADVLRRIRP